MVKPRNLQAGLTFLSLVIILILIGGVALIGVKVAPAVIENHGINVAIEHSAQEGKSVVEVRSLFDKNAETGYIDSITGKDLNVEKNSQGHLVVSYEYEKKIALFGPVSLLIDFAGSAEGN